MRRSAWWIACAVLAGCATPAVRDAAEVSAPASDRVAPTLDGLIQGEEWRGAREERLGASGRLKVLRVGDTVFVAVTGGADGIATLCVGTQDRVWLLHASAALGTGEYELTGEGWRRTRDFEWAARDAADEEGRSAFLAQEGWLANVARGGADREFELRLGRFGDGARFVAGYLHTGKTMRLALFPERVTDACAELELHRGALPEKAAFAPELWAGFPEP